MDECAEMQRCTMADLRPNTELERWGEAISLQIHEVVGERAK